MNLPNAILRAVSLAVPESERSEWLRTWRSELFYVPADRATGFTLGAVRDAYELRRELPLPDLTASPWHCIATLSVLAVLAGATALLLSTSSLLNPAFHLHPVRVTEVMLMTGTYTIVLFPLNRLAMGRDAAHPAARTWRTRVRLGLFLMLKLALVQPVLLCGLYLFFMTARLFAFAPQLGLLGSWFFTFRWVLSDQRRRCPECLHLLTDPVRIGSPSHTLLDWYGAESVCSRGHGLLHTSQSWPSYSEDQRWLRLDASWKTLFPSPGVRQ